MKNMFNNSSEAEHNYHATSPQIHQLPLLQLAIHPQNSASNNQEQIVSYATNRGAQANNHEPSGTGAEHNPAPIYLSGTGFDAIKLEIAELDDQLSKTNTLDFEELKSELGQAKREIEAEDEQHLLLEQRQQQQRKLQKQKKKKQKQQLLQNDEHKPVKTKGMVEAQMVRRQQKTVRTSCGEGIIDAESGMMVPIVNDSSHAAPISVCQYVNPMETDYSQTDSPTSKAKVMKHYDDLHSMSPPEPTNCEITVSSAAEDNDAADHAGKNNNKKLFNNQQQIFQDVCCSPLSGSDSLENLRQRRDHIRSQIKTVSSEIKEMESEIQKELRVLEGREREDESRFSQSQTELDRQIIELKRRQDSLQRQMDAKQAQLCELVEAGQSMDHNQSFGCLSELPPDSAKIREVDLDLKIQIERVMSLKQKCAQSLSNLEKLRELYGQISEEICMTNEDKEAQKQVQADLVARREDLDLILFEQSKNIYGQEFSVFLQLMQQQQSNCPSNKKLELQAIYRAKKTATFINDVIHQLEQIKDSSEDTPSERSKAQKKTFAQQTCMLQQMIQQHMSIHMGHGGSDGRSCDLADESENTLLASLVDLAGVIGINTLTQAILKEKLEQCSQQKDQIFGAKANKMQEIGASIRQLDQAIEEKRNLIENLIDSSLNEALGTLQQTQVKIIDMETAYEILLQKVQMAEKSIGDLRVQESSMQREKDRIIQIKSTQLEFDQLREQRHSLLEKQLFMADQQRQIEREHRTSIAQLRKKKRKLESQSKVLLRKAQREKLEHQLSQIEDLISQTIIQQEKRFVEFQQREIQQQWRFSRDNGFSVTQQPAQQVLAHHHNIDKNKEGLLSENNAMSHIGSSSQFLTATQLKSQDEEDGTSSSCPKTEGGEPPQHILQTKSTIEFNTDKQEQRKRDVNTIKYQSQSLGVNHSVNHNFHSNVRSSNMSTIEEQKRPSFIIEQKENVIQESHVQPNQVKKPEVMQEPSIQTAQQADLDMIRNLLLQQQAQLIKLQQAQEMQNNKSGNHSNSDMISQQVVSSNQLTNMLAQTAQSPLQNAQLTKQLDMKMWKTNDGRAADPREEMPTSPLQFSQSLFNQTKVNNELPMQQTLRVNGEDAVIANNLNQKTYMSFAENSGSLTHQFNRLITQESFGHPVPKATNKTNLINSIQSKQLQPVEYQQMMTFQNSDAISQKLHSQNKNKHQNRYHQSNMSNEEAAISNYIPLDGNSTITQQAIGCAGGGAVVPNSVSQIIPDDPSIAHASSLQLLSPLSQSMSMHVGMQSAANTVSIELPSVQQQHQKRQQQHNPKHMMSQQSQQNQLSQQNNRSQSREGSQTRILVAQPLATPSQLQQNQIVNTSCQEIGLTRNVLSSDTLDQHYCQSEMPLTEIPVQQRSMESLNFNQHFIMNNSVQQHQPPRTEEQKPNRRTSQTRSGQSKASFITRPKSQTRKRQKVQQEASGGRYATNLSSGKRSEGQARKNTNFIKKKVNQSLAYKNQSVNYVNHQQHQLGQDLELISRLLPLIDGQILYKKFSTHQSISQKAFDPLHAEKSPPENCGYGIRLFQLSQDLQVITVKQSLRNSVELTISVDKILKPILPQTTLDIIKEQQQQSSNNRVPRHQNNALLQQQQDLANRGAYQGASGQGCQRDQQNLINEEYQILEPYGKDQKHKSITQLAKLGILDKRSEIYRTKCANSSFYPFSIALEQFGHIELIATNPESLQTWIFGLNFLIQNKEQSQKMQALLQMVLQDQTVYI